MLVLSRKQGEAVVIGDDIRITVVAVRGNRVQLGFTAPPNLSIHRNELGLEAADRASLPDTPAVSKAEP